MTRHVALAILLISLAPLPGSGQHDLAQLRATHAAHPDDARAACDLAFGLVGASEHREAIEVASAAIARLRTATDRAQRRLLGACLYNRGRAHEGLAEPSLAIADYADSLDLRPNDTVAARLRTLAPEYPADAPLAALAMTIEGFGLEPDVVPTRATTADRHPWLFVSSERMATPAVAAVTRPCGEPSAVAIDESYFDNYGSLEVVSARPRRLGDIDALVVEIRGAGDATCGRMDGVVDASHAATLVVFIDGCQIRTASFVTRQFVCDQRHDSGLAVRFDDAGNAITTRRSGLLADDAELGTFALRTIAR